MARENLPPRFDPGDFFGREVQDPLPPFDRLDASPFDGPAGSDPRDVWSAAARADEGVALMMRGQAMAAAAAARAAALRAEDAQFSKIEAVDQTAAQTRVDWLINKLGRTPFGTMLRDEFGTEVPDDMLARIMAREMGTPTPVDRSASRWRLPHAGSYAAVSRREIAQIRDAGLPVEVAFEERDAQFCRGFLACMQELGYPGSQRLHPATHDELAMKVTPIRGFPQEPRIHLTELLARLDPKPFYQLGRESAASSSLSWSPGAGLPEYSDYGAFIRQYVESGLIPGTEDTSAPSWQGYKLMPLNDKLWLYLCEDESVRVMVDERGGVLPAPPQPDGELYRRRPLWLDPIYPGEARHVGVWRVNPTTDGRRAHSYYELACEPASYPPRERLLDYAGRALTGRGNRSRADYGATVPGLLKDLRKS